MIEILLVFLFLYYRFRDRLWRVDYDLVNQGLKSRESKHGRVKWGLIQTGWMMLALVFYARLSSHCAYMGKYYAALAANPFAFDPSNPVPHRILTSLISYALFLRGHLIIVTNLLIAAALLLVVYLHFRKMSFQPVQAFLVSAIIAFSMVTINTVYYGGYNDSLTYLLIYLMWAVRRKRLLFHFLFLLGLLNREATVFLIPWFIYISFEDARSKGGRLVELAGGFAVTLGLYFLFRHWISLHQPIEYSASLYLGGFLADPFAMMGFHVENVGLAAFSVFKLMWVVPLVAAIGMWRNGDRRQFFSLVLLVACSVGQLFFAYDTTRLLTLAFMVMPLSLYYLYKYDIGRYRTWLLPAFIFNLLIPNVNIAGVKIDVVHSLSAYIISHAMR